MIWICKKFLKDRSAGFSVIGVVVILQVVTVFIFCFDYILLLKKKREAEFALNATLEATADFLQKNPSLDRLGKKKYAEEFLNLNLHHIKFEDIKLDIKWPAEKDHRLTMSIEFNTKNQFMHMFFQKNNHKIKLFAEKDFKENKTLEIVFLIDHSNQMYYRSSNGQNRHSIIKKHMLSILEKLKEKTKTMGEQKNAIKISYIPFGLIMNVGSKFADKDWIDTRGLSPIHYEMFDLGQTITLEENKKIIAKTDSLTKQTYYLKQGIGWKGTEGDRLTRLTLYKDMTTVMRSQHGIFDLSRSYSFSWYGCVEARPYPYNVQDTGADRKRPETFFVPAFLRDDPDGGFYDYWPDDVSRGKKHKKRDEQRDIVKYFMSRPDKTNTYSVDDYSHSPNWICYPENEIEELKDIVDSFSFLKTQINSTRVWQAHRSRYIAEGLAWAWRVLSPQEPFTEGRSYETQGNYKFIILITTGGNNIRIRSSDFADDAHDMKNFSEYGAYGYLGQEYKNFKIPRTLLKKYPKGTSGTMKNRSTEAIQELNQYQKEVCQSIKQKGIILITLLFDHSGKNEDQDTELLKECASSSKKTRKKLFHTTNGALFSNSEKAILDAINNETSYQ